MENVEKCRYIRKTDIKEKILNKLQGYCKIEKANSLKYLFEITVEQLKDDKFLHYRRLTKKEKEIEGIDKYDTGIYLIRGEYGK